MVKDNEIKVIVDTNLWISWLITKDYKKLDKVFLKKNFKLVFSLELIEEFIEVVHRPKLRKYFSKKDIETIIQFIYESALFVDVKSQTTGCRDEKDNFLLALAIDSKADFLLTGDKDLLEIKKIGKTRIIAWIELLEKA